MENKKEQKRQLKGVVTSDKMNKTVVVSVTRVKAHKKYLKQYNVSKKFKAHDENNEFKEGDEVVIEESKPLSKTKHWRVVSKI